MNPVDLERFLTQAVADRKLSGGEKQALAGWLSQNVKTDQHRGLARHAAFAAARKAVADPAAAEVIGWLEDVLKVVAPIQQPAAAGGAAAGSHPETVCFAPGDGCLRTIVSRFQACRRTADVCVFTITDDRIARAILDAHGRGVKVRIITDNEKMHDMGSDIKSFQFAGIPVKLDAPRPHPRGDTLDGHMHHKFALFDGTRLLNGSYNWTRGAADMNYENLVETDDPVLVAAFAAEFERLWKEF